MRFKRISDNHYTRVESHPRGPYDTQRKKTERRTIRQICFASFYLGFVITSIFLGGKKVHAQPPAVIFTSGKEEVGASGQVAAGVYKPPERLTLRKEIEQYIRYKFGKDGERALKIAYCESNLNTQAIGVNKNGSVDRGIFQLNTVHKSITSECAFNAKCNIDAAHNIYLKQGFKPWVCSHRV